MSDLISKSALKAVKFHPLPYTHIVPTDADAESYKWGWNDAIDAIIESAPTIDAVPVVRCKDCKWWGLSSYNTAGIHICKKYNGVRFDSDYCSRAERREE